MADNVTWLPRPRAVQPATNPLGLYIRASRNDHKLLLTLLSAGGLGGFGVVIEAVHSARHKELREHVVEQGLDALLDPQTQASATIGGYTDGLGRLPWGVGRPHQLSDFRGPSGRGLIEKLGDHAMEHGFTQLIAPTHLLQGATDPWLRTDIDAVGSLRHHLDRNGAERMPLIYSLAIPYRVLRDPFERRSLISALEGAPVSAIWLKVDRFGSSSSPTAARSYIDASADFREVGLPLAGDQVGGLVGLGLLAFGAVGGIAHGVTMQERFDASHWRKHREADRGSPMPKRVYIRDLDLMLKPAKAKLLFETSTRAWRMFGCRDHHCCPRRKLDMIENPGRHFLYGRIQDVVSLGQVPETLRTQTFLEQFVRPKTDLALAAANINWSNDAMAKKTREQRKRLDDLRIAFSYQKESNPPRTFASTPAQRVVREAQG